MYCTFEEVKNLTGHTEEDFDSTDIGEYKELVESWITQASSLIDLTTGRTWDIAGDDEIYIPVLSNACLRIVANQMQRAIQYRTSPVERIDDFTLRVIPPTILTNDILADLALLPGAPPGFVASYLAGLE